MPGNQVLLEDTGPEATTEFPPIPITCMTGGRNDNLLKAKK